MDSQRIGGRRPITGRLAQYRFEKCRLDMRKKLLVEAAIGRSLGKLLSGPGSHRRVEIGGWRAPRGFFNQRRQLIDVDPAPASQ